MIGKPSCRLCGLAGTSNPAGPRAGILCGLLLVLAMAGFATSRAAEAAANPLDGISFEALAYLDYSYGQTPLPGDQEADYNRFSITRGYFTFKRQATPWLGARYTVDVYQDATGDYKRRDKYLYAEFKPKNVGFFTNLTAELGLGHIPWLDFEEHVNPYRCQGTMAIERAGIFNSADLGVSLRGYLGGELDRAAVQKTGNKSYAGRYGSWHMGVYNGGGYHAAENNENKVMEGRLTVRPLASTIPGLQVSYLGIYGKGNLAAPDPANKDSGGLPDYWVNLGMLSFERSDLILTAQYFATDGNAKGDWVTGNDALHTEGYSFFGSARLPIRDDRWRLLARYDHFDGDADHVIAQDTAYDMVLGGLSYDLYKGNLFMVVFEWTDYEANAQGKGKLPSADPVNLGNEQKVQVVYQIKL